MFVNFLKKTPAAEMMWICYRTFKKIHKQHVACFLFKAPAPENMWTYIYIFIYLFIYIHIYIYIYIERERDMYLFLYLIIFGSYHKIMLIPICL